jgi:hypothetical protein
VIKIKEKNIVEFDYVLVLSSMYRMKGTVLLITLFLEVIHRAKWVY